MYPIQNVNYYKLYDVYKDEYIDYFYSDEELIKYIARRFRTSIEIDEMCNYHPVYSNTFIELCTCDINDFRFADWSIRYRRYLLFDNYDRIINVRDFEAAALKLFKSDETYKNAAINRWYEEYRPVSKKKQHRRKRMAYKRRMDDNYIYRRTPVPHTRKQRGGSFQRPPHTLPILRMYDNPDYKYFNRGSCKMIPRYWDDKFRPQYRSWKEQSKSRHQWK